MKLQNILKSDLYQFCYSPLWLIHLFIPILGVVLFLGYYSISIVNNFNKISAYIQVLSISFPFLIGIVISVTVENEQSAGNFQMLFTSPTKKYKGHFSKLIVLIFFGFVSSVLALVGFGIGFDYEVLNITFYFNTAILLSISVLPLYMLQYIISLFCGNGFGLVFGTVGSLLSALLLTGLGDGIWSFLPWGITARFSHILFKSMAMNTTFFNSSGVIPSIIFILISSAIFLMLLVFLLNKWEGRRLDD